MVEPTSSWELETGKWGSTLAPQTAGWEMAGKAPHLSVKWVGAAVRIKWDR